MRDISADVLAEISGGLVRPFYLVSMQVLTATLYMWTGIGTLNWNGHDWSGMGVFGEVSPVTLTQNVTAENVTLTLSGIKSADLPQDWIEIARTEIRQNFPVHIYLGFADAEGIVISNPFEISVGRTDVPTLNDGGDTCRIDITVETPMIALQSACNRRYTPDDQKITYPTDKGFDYVAAVQNWNKAWGKR